MTSFARFGGLAPLVLLVVAACSTTPGTSPASIPPSAAPSTDAPAASPMPSQAAPSPSVAPSDPNTTRGWILYDPDLDAPAAVDAALAAAASDGRNVLIEYGADWCPDCHVLAAYLEDPRAAAILEESYHVVRVDVGVFDRNLETATRYGNAIAVGIPSVVILDHDGVKLVDTAAGELATSSRYTVDDIVSFLAAWQP